MRWRPAVRYALFLADGGRRQRVSAVRVQVAGWDGVVREEWDWRVRETDEPARKGRRVLE